MLANAHTIHEMHYADSQEHSVLRKSPSAFSVLRIFIKFTYLMDSILVQAQNCITPGVLLKRHLDLQVKEIGFILFRGVLIQFVVE